MNLRIAHPKHPGSGASKVMPTVATIGLACLVILAGVGAEAQSPGQSQKLENVMSASADHEVLKSITGTFDVKVKTWLDPAAPTVEGTLTATNGWVLDGAYLETKLEGTIGGESFSEIGYLGFDAAKEQWEAVRMNTAFPGMIWYRGEFDDSGTHITLRAEVRDPATGSPSLRELKIHIEDDGNHTTEVWASGPSNMMFKTKEFRYTRENR